MLAQRRSRGTAAWVLAAICLAGCGGSNAAKKQPSPSVTSTSVHSVAPTAPTVPTVPSATEPNKQALEAYAEELMAHLRTTELLTERVRSTRLVPNGRPGAYNVVMTTDLPPHTVAEISAAQGRESGQIREDISPRAGIGVHCDHWIRSHRALEVDLCEVLDSRRSGLGAGVPIDLNPPGPLKTRSPEQTARDTKISKAYRAFHDTLGPEYRAHVQQASGGLASQLALWSFIDDKWHLTFYTRFPARDPNEPGESVRTSEVGQAFAREMLRWAEEHRQSGIVSVRVLDDEFRLVGVAWRP